jgi:hypothetical protein
MHGQRFLMFVEKEGEMQKQAINKRQPLPGATAVWVGFFCGFPFGTRWW